MSDQLYPYFLSLWQKLQTFQTPDNGPGTTRLAFTDADQMSRRWIQEIWEDIGLSTHIDGVGNVVGTLGTPPYILIGSHTDTVPHGGNYDGILGLLAATAAAHDWLDLDRGLMVVDWSSEESSRFGISTLGSRLAVGENQTSYWGTQDQSGMTLSEAVHQSYGYPDIPILNLCEYPIKAALELHIEQGTELQEHQCALGIVTAIAAPQRWSVIVDGQANHSAGTAMGRRTDALAAAAQLTLAIEALSTELESSGLRSTMTRLNVLPGAANVVPGQVIGLIDVRAQSQAVLSRYRKALNTTRHRIEEQRHVQIRLAKISGETPGALDPSLREIMQQVLEHRKVRWMHLPSWPSHDSLPLSRHVPSAMLLVRNPSGLSHNSEETLDAEDIQAALTAFYAIVVSVHEHIGGSCQC